MFFENYTCKAPDATSGMIVRLVSRDDLPELVRIYNHYVENSYAAFDTEPVTIESRTGWLERFSEIGPHRLLVASEGDRVLGCASSGPYRDHPAFASTVEVGIYLHPDQMRAQAPGFRHGVERATKWYNESLDTERGSTSRASGVAGVEAAREPTSQLLCGGTGSGASGQSGSAKASTTPAYGGDGESRPRDSRGETGIPRIYPWGGSQYPHIGTAPIAGQLAQCRAWSFKL